MSPRFKKVKYKDWFLLLNGIYSGSFKYEEINKDLDDLTKLFGLQYGFAKEHFTSIINEFCTTEEGQEFNLKTLAKRDFVLKSIKFSSNYRQEKKLLTQEPSKEELENFFKSDFCNRLKAKNANDKDPFNDEQQIYTIDERSILLYKDLLKPEDQNSFNVLSLSILFHYVFDYSEKQALSNTEYSNLYFQRRQEIIPKRNEMLTFSDFVTLLDINDPDLKLQFIEEFLYIYRNSLPEEFKKMIKEEYFAERSEQDESVAEIEKDEILMPIDMYQRQLQLQLQQFEQLEQGILFNNTSMNDINVSETVGDISNITCYEPTFASGLYTNTIDNLKKIQDINQQSNQAMQNNINESDCLVNLKFKALRNRIIRQTNYSQYNALNDLQSLYNEVSNRNLEEQKKEITDFLKAELELQIQAIESFFTNERDNSVSETPIFFTEEEYTNSKDKFNALKNELNNGELTFNSLSNKINEFHNTLPHNANITSMRRFFRWFLSLFRDTTELQQNEKVVFSTEAIMRKLGEVQQRQNSTVEANDIPATPHEDNEPHEIDEDENTFNQNVQK